MTKKLLFACMGLLALAYSHTAWSFFGMMNPSKWMGNNNNDRDYYYDRYDRYDRYGPYGYGPHGHGPYGGYGGYGAPYGYPGAYPYGYLPQQNNNTPPPLPLPK